MRTIFITIAFIIAVMCLPHIATGDTSDYEGTQAAILKLQPRVEDDRASRLAGFITQHAGDSRIDPLLVTSLIFRESSFSHAVETGRRRGRPPQKCVGLMQVFPWGAAHKLGGYCDLTDADCNIRTGVMWLEYVRSTCGDTHWQWVASYGMSRCPTYRTARKNSATVAARTIYCRIQDNCEEMWPRWERR